MRLIPDLERAARRLESHVEAQDLVQETCRRALESHDQFSSGSNMRAWLLRILRNLHRDRSRRVWREIFAGDTIEVLPTRDPDPTPAWVRVSDDDLALAIESLSPPYRMAYLLHAVQGHPYSFIAGKLGIPPGTVGTRLLRARTQLRRFLSQRLGNA
jgi:RNA polymerase sigma-70 factor (ECF subfamily)